jgi:chromosome segregation ATPase
MRFPAHAVLGGLLAIALGSACFADPPASSEDRLREALRDSMLQLRGAQSDLANLQATQAAAAEEKKALADKYDALKKQVVIERAGSDRSVASLTAKVAEDRDTIAHLNRDLARLSGEVEKTSSANREAEAAVTKLKAEKIVLERRVSDLQAKNLALFLTGNTILSRYAEFSLGTAISAKEPFVSLTRTKLENLVQDYQDELLDQRDKP